MADDCTRAHLNKHSEDGEWRNEEGPCHSSRQRPELDGVLKKGPHHSISQHLQQPLHSQQLQRCTGVPAAPHAQRGTRGRFDPCSDIIYQDQSAAYLHDTEIGCKQGVAVGGRQEAADGAPAPARLPQLTRLQRHAALEQPCCCQRGLVRLHRHKYFMRGYQPSPPACSKMSIFC